jgi:hypothetical protein
VFTIPICVFTMLRSERSRYSEIRSRGLGEHDDWRLQTIEELQSIVDLSATGCMTGGLCINSIFTPTQSDFYWSASTYVGASDLVWSVDFEYGDVFVLAKASAFYVRAVRSGS